MNQRISIFTIYRIAALQSFKGFFSIRIPKNSLAERGPAGKALYYLPDCVRYHNLRGVITRNPSDYSAKLKLSRLFTTRGKYYLAVPQLQSIVSAEKAEIAKNSEDSQGLKYTPYLLFYNLVEAYKRGQPLWLSKPDIFSFGQGLLREELMEKLEGVQKEYCLKVIEEKKENVYRAYPSLADMLEFDRRHADELFRLLGRLYLSRD